MASSSVIAKLVCAILVCMVVTAPQAEAAISSCGQVTSALVACIPYATGKGLSPSAACCGGIKSVNTAASTTADRKTACGCLKSLTSSIHGVNFAKVAGLPSKCGVKVPYAISPSTNCNAIH